MSVWKVLGYNLVLFLVGIRNIPRVYLEAASLDGASAWQRFWHVTLPLLKPILLYVLVTATINSFNVFTQVYVMTLGSQAAPGQAVRVLVFDIYQNAFQYLPHGLRLGRGGDADLHRARLHADPVPAVARARRRHRCGGASAHRCGAPRPDRACARGAADRRACFMVLPMLWMLATSFKPPPEIAVWPPRLLPQAPTLANYTGMFEVAPFGAVLRQQRRHVAGRDAQRCGHLAARRRGVRQVPLPGPDVPLHADHRDRDRAVRELHDPALYPADRDRLDQHLSGHRPAHADHELRHLPDPPAHVLGDPDRATSRPRGSTARRNGGSSSA